MELNYPTHFRSRWPVHIALMCTGIWLLFGSLTWCEAAAYNHPHLRWRSFQSEHFVFHYHTGTEPSAFRIAQIAETVYPKLCRIYNYFEKGKVHLHVRGHDDYSNGFADYISRNIMISAVESDFALRGSSNWLWDVVTHELAHMVTLRANSKSIAPWASLQASFQTSTVKVDATMPVSLVSQFPMAMAEGLAQMEAHNQGVDFWDTHRDMLLRTALLSGKELSLAEMGHFNHTGLRNELVYNQGFSFVLFLHEKYGRAVLTQLVRGTHNSDLTFTGSFAKSFHRITGDPLAYAYEEWRTKHLRRYQEKRKQLEADGLKEGTVVYENGYLNLRPRISPDGQYLAFFTNDRDDAQLSDFVVARLHPAFSIVRRIPFAHTDCRWSPDGKRVYFMQNRIANQKGSHLNDVFSMDLSSGRVSRITRNGRVYAFDVVPGSEYLLLVKYHRSRYSICRFNMRSGREGVLYQSEMGHPIHTISVDPKTRQKALFSILGPVSEDIWMVDFESGKAEPILEGNADERDPFWGEDGYFYFACDQTGIFNLYRKPINGGASQQLTRTLGGAFQPEVDLQSEKIVFSAYSQNGFDIRQCALASVGTEQEHAQPDSDPKPTILLPDHRAGLFHSYPYTHPLVRPNLVPLVSFFYQDTLENTGSDFRQVTRSALGAGFLLELSDALGKRSLQTNFTLSLPLHYSESLQNEGEAGAFPYSGSMPFSRWSKMAVSRQPHHSKHLGLPRAVGKGRKLGAEAQEEDTPQYLFGFTQFGYMNRDTRATLGLNVGVQTIHIYPVGSEAILFGHLPLGEWWTLSLSPTFGSNLVFPDSLGDTTRVIKVSHIPLYWTFLKTGHMHADYVLNPNDLFFFSGGAAPVFGRLKAPGAFNRNLENLPADEVWAGYSIFGQIESGLRLGKRGGVRPSGEISHRGFPGQSAFAVTGTPASDDTSSWELTGKGDVVLAFPLLRRINRCIKSTHDGPYFSAIYGELSSGVQSRLHAGENASVQAKQNAVLNLGLALRIGLWSDYLFFHDLKIGSSYQFPFSTPAGGNLQFQFELH